MNFLWPRRMQGLDQAALQPNQLEILERFHHVPAPNRPEKGTTTGGHRSSPFLDRLWSSMRADFLRKMGTSTWLFPLHILEMEMRQNKNPKNQNQRGTEKSNSSHTCLFSIAHQKPRRPLAKDGLEKAHKRCPFFFAKPFWQPKKQTNKRKHAPHVSRPALAGVLSVRDRRRLIPFTPPPAPHNRSPWQPRLGGGVDLVIPSFLWSLCLWNFCWRIRSQENRTEPKKKRNWWLPSFTEFFFIGSLVVALWTVVGNRM